MPIPTPEQLHVALADHRRVRDACKALGTSLAAIRNRRWYVTSKTDPVFGMDGRDVRAVIMPMRQP